MIRPATPADADGIAAAHVASRSDAYRGLVPPEALARQSVAERAERWRGILAGLGDRHRAAVAVAETDGGIVGLISCGEQRDDALRDRGLTGEVSALYLVRDAQGQGLGRALMGWAADHLLARGHQGMALWCQARNLQARGFYERLGGVSMAEKEDDLLGHPTTEVAYGWPALAALASTTASTAAAASANIGVGSSQ